MNRIAIYPGSFNPFTLGHKNIADKSIELFDKLFIAIGKNNAKNNIDYYTNKIEVISRIFENNSKIEIIEYDELTVNLCEKLGAKYIVRSARNIMDFENEKTLAIMNKKLSKKIETILIFPDEEFINISSTLVREIIKNKVDASMFLP